MWNEPNADSTVVVSDTALPCASVRGSEGSPRRAAFSPAHPNSATATVTATTTVPNARIWSLPLSRTPMSRRPSRELAMSG